MYNKKDLGKRIAAKRHLAGITREGLIERIGDDNMSLPTLNRIERGDSHLNLDFLTMIAEAMGYKLQDLIDDESIRSNAEKLYFDPQADHDDNRMEIDCAVYKQQLFYPMPLKGSFYDNYPIKTLLQLILYLPLLDERLLYDSLLRIGGDLFRNEEYVLDQLLFLYKSIPESDAKRFADSAVKEYTYENFKNFYAEGTTESDRIWMDPERCDEVFIGYDAYMALIKEKLKQAKKTDGIES